MKKYCCICGGEFSARPSDKRTTCGKPECRASRRDQQIAEAQNAAEAAKSARRVIVVCPICGEQSLRSLSRANHKKTCGRRKCEIELRRRNGLAQFGDCKQHRICPECGLEFRTAPSSPQKTCGRRECISSYISATASGYDLSPMKSAHDASPDCQPDEKNAWSKYWSVRSPSGEVFRFQNLAHFVRSHRDFFTADELRIMSGQAIYAAMGIGMLRPDRARHIGSWHGWTWEE